MAVTAYLIWAQYMPQLQVTALHSSPGRSGWQGEKTHCSLLPLQTCQPGRVLGLFLLTLLNHGPFRAHEQCGENPGAQSGLRATARSV